jgi:predicted nucleotidyltransferase
MTALTFIPYMTQHEIVAACLAEAQRDPDVVGLLLAGSFARRDALPGSDVDLYVLLRDGCERPNRSELQGGVLVEWQYNDLARAKAKLASNPMTIYTHLDGHVLYDLENQFPELIRLAQEAQDSFSVTEKDRAAIAHWLLSASLKVVAARAAGDQIKVAFVVSSTTYQVFAGLWAVNQKPMPASGGVLAHLNDLPLHPDHIPGWLESFLTGNLEERAATFAALCDWLIPLLTPLDSLPSRA